MYKIRIDSDLRMDIDYILKWNEPEFEGMPFTFWVAPSTLVFKEISDLVLDLESDFRTIVEIDDIEMKPVADTFQWEIYTQNGLILFKSSGFEQYIRQEPFFEFGQTIPYVDRGGYSLECTTRQENPNRFSDEVVRRRTKDLEDFQVVKKRHLKKRELSELKKLRDNKGIEVKDFLSRKRELDDEIYSCNFFLKETRFSEW
jgi:hypothetical protein